MTSAIYSLDIPDAEIHLLPPLQLPLAEPAVLQELVQRTPWRSAEIKLWGNCYQLPRLTAWYGNPGASYAYSGICLTPMPWTDLLADIKGRVERATDALFNSVLLNYYRDHRDSIGLHSDDEPELGPHPTIASLSLGAERTFIFKHKTRRQLRFRVPLVSGSLLLMKGETQRHWKHGIGKRTRSCGPRVNLTFRRITI